MHASFIAPEIDDALGMYDVLSLHTKLQRMRGNSVELQFGEARGNGHPVKLQSLDFTRLGSTATHPLGQLDCPVQLDDAGQYGLPRKVTGKAAVFRSKVKQETIWFRICRSVAKPRNHWRHFCAEFGITNRKAAAHELHQRAAGQLLRLRGQLAAGWLVLVRERKLVAHRCQFDPTSVFT